ncbi:MAG: hypothetical protein H0U69_03650 [Trueperaceae bacterium]|nr:hypothetical protein [Trueperaceae bacterium]
MTKTQAERIEADQARRDAYIQAALTGLLAGREGDLLLVDIGGDAVQYAEATMKAAGES